MSVFLRPVVKPNLPNWLTSRRYDGVFSIGRGCGCAFFLRRLHLRTMSGPWDWVGGSWQVLQRVAHIENRFAGWLQPENLEPPRRMGRIVECEDRKQDVFFLHDFHLRMPFPEELALVRARYQRRQRRFFETVAQSKHILLVWFNVTFETTPKEAFEEGIRRLRQALGAHVDCLAIEHDPTLKRREIRCEEIAPGACVLAHVNLSTLRNGQETVVDAVSGDNHAAVRAILRRVHLREDLARATRRHDRRLWWSRKVRQFVAGIIPFRALRRKIRGQFE